MAPCSSTHLLRTCQRQPLQRCLRHAHALRRADGASLYGIARGWHAAESRLMGRANATNDIRPVRPMHKRLSHLHLHRRDPPEVLCLRPVHLRHILMKDVAGPPLLVVRSCAARAAWLKWSMQEPGQDSLISKRVDATSF